MNFFVEKWKWFVYLGHNAFFNYKILVTFFSGTEMESGSPRRID